MTKPLILLLGTLLAGCSGSSEGRAIWHDDSVSIAFKLWGPWGEGVCEFSATREELTVAQRDGLASLRLTDSVQRAGCDIPRYSITIHGPDGSASDYWATDIECLSLPIVLFEDFDAWATSTPCSLQHH